MIDDIDHRLNSWITSVIDNHFKVSFEHPGNRQNPATISAYLYRLDNALPTSAARDIPFKIILSYLLTVQSDDPLESHQMLGKLLFAAKEQEDFEIQFPTLPADFWQSFGTAPLPYFILCLPLLKTKKAKAVPLIKQPPVVDISPLNSIKGVVLGPNKHPIAAAKITLDYSKTTAHTDKNGHFMIASDAKTMTNFNCKINAQGKEYSVSIPLQEMQNTPITIHLDTLEV